MPVARCLLTVKTTRAPTKSTPDAPFPGAVGLLRGPNWTLWIGIAIVVGIVGWIATAYWPAGQQ